MANHCNAWIKTCRNCSTRSKKHKSMKCQECGADRGCRASVKEKGKRCKRHGGKSLKGVAHPNFIHGRRSKYMPKGDLDTFNAYLADPDRTNLDNETALSRLITERLLEQFYSIDTQDTWEKANKHYKEMIAAQKNKKREKFASMLVEFEQILKAGAGQGEHIASIKSQLEETRKLVATQHKMEIDYQQSIPMAMVFAFVESLLKVVHEQISPIEGGAVIIQEIQEAARFGIEPVSR